MVRWMGEIISYINCPMGLLEVAWGKITADDVGGLFSFLLVWLFRARLKYDILMLLMKYNLCRHLSMMIHVSSLVRFRKNNHHVDMVRMNHKRAFQK